MSHLEHRYLLFMFLAYAVTWILALGFFYRMHQKTRAMERMVQLLHSDLTAKSLQRAASQDQPPLSGPSV